MHSSLTTSGSHLQVLIPILFISNAFLIPFIASRLKCSVRWWAVAVNGVALLLSINLLGQIMGSANGYLDYFPGHSWGGARYLASGQPIGIVIRSDILGGIMLLLVTGVGLLVTLYSSCYIIPLIPPHKEKYYYTLLLLMFAGMCGICLTGDCFNLYVFLEVASISAYALVAISGKPSSLEAALKYMLIGAFSSILVLFGIGLLFSATGTLNMAYAAQQISKILSSAADSPLNPLRYIVFASLALLIMGFSIKSAFFPAHAWLADVHPVAPSSISAMLSGLVVKITGVFLLIRFVFGVFRVQPGHYGQLFSLLLLIIAGISAVGGSLFAIAQADLKRMLAYSTIAQLGYILIGVGLMSKAGLSGAILHIINHAVMKALLFLCAGAIIYNTGIRKISEMGRIGYRMPVTMFCFTIGALSMIGVPPLSGFMSKWVLISASLEEHVPLMAMVLILGSLLNAAYYLRVVLIAFVGKPSPGVAVSGATKTNNPGVVNPGVVNPRVVNPRVVNPKVKDVPWLMLIPMITLASATILLGLRLDWIMQGIELAVTNIYR
jgi:multicomponent Na+:H+ antiporter subunit D